MPTIEDFAALDIRVGTVIEASSFPKARKPAIKLMIDFGAELGRKRSSAQLTTHYTPDALMGRQVAAVVNFPPRRIAGFESEVLVLGAMPTSDEVILLKTGRPVLNGTRIGRGAAECERGRGRRFDTFASLSPAMRYLSYMPAPTRLAAQLAREPVEGG